MKLYHYVHCPFCVRVRMVLGLLNTEFESIVLPYDDEKTPIDLQGIKMLPIFQWATTDSSNESLEIISRLDKDNILQNQLINSDEFHKVEEHLSRLGSNVHSLCMPYWMWTNEFNERSRSYFQKKKEVKRGPFNKLILNKDQYLLKLNKDLDLLSQDIDLFYKSDKITILDICIASHIWGMYIFPEFQFKTKINDYLQRVKKECSFEYHIDFWRNKNE